MEIPWRSIELHTVEERPPRTSTVKNVKGVKIQAVRPVRDAVVIPTGGQMFPIDAKEPLSDAFIAAIRAFRTSYVLRYSPSGVDKSGWHAVAVSITRPGRYNIRARKGYGG